MSDDLLKAHIAIKALEGALKDAILARIEAETKLATLDVTKKLLQDTTSALRALGHDFVLLWFSACGRTNMPFELMSQLSREPAERALDLIKEQTTATSETYDRWFATEGLPVMLERWRVALRERP